MMKKIKGKNSIQKNIQLQKVTQEQQKPQQVPQPQQAPTQPTQQTQQVQPTDNSVFFSLDRDFSANCKRFDSQAIGLIQISRELIQEQHLMRQRYEMALAERTRAIESNERLMLRILNLSDDLTIENFKQGETPLPQILEFLQVNLIEFIKREGVKEIPVKTGEVYNPANCEVAAKCVDNNLPPDTVVKVLAPGYMCGATKLRNAKVQISKKEEQVTKQ
jgi:molecular chaperone GrpE (heat shock protein)